MADDWRITVELVEEADASSLVYELERTELPRERRARLGDRVAVSSNDEGTVFLYADTEEVAREANVLVRETLDRLGMEADTALSRWHPVEQRWEDPEVPLPRTEEEWRVEHERLQAREAEESRETGEAAWEVRIELPDHDATAEVGDRLEREGMPVVRRWTYLLVGAANEDEAHALAERLRDEAPAGSRVQVEPGGRLAWEVAPQNPFAVFGGLGG
jgi:hypothetical protein